MLVFACDKCSVQLPLTSLADLSCPCSLCTVCATLHVERVLASRLAASSSAAAAAVSFESGQAIWYTDGRGQRHEAVVEHVDRSVLPPQYEIRLQGGDNTRFTEARRLAPKAPPAAAAVDLHTVPCQRCGQNTSTAVAPAAVAAAEEALTSQWMRTHAVIRCPYQGCSALIERVQGQRDARASSAGGRAAAGAGMSQEGEEHMQAHRYRCGMCKRDFCDACHERPYHRGWTCQQARMPDCRFCGAKVLQNPLLMAGQVAPDGQPGGSAGLEGMCTKEVRRLVQQLGADVSWCLERRELLAVGRRCLEVCSSAACRERLGRCCMRQLPCGHSCCGVRGEARCLPCLEPRCRAAPAAAACSGLGSASGCRAGGAHQEVKASGPEEQCCLCWEQLAAGGCIALQCGHLVHLACAQQRLQAGYPGPAISFTHLFCPLCGTEEGRSGNVQVASASVAMQHPLLEEQLRPHLQLRDAVVALAKERLRLEHLGRSEPALQPGGSYDGRPADFALKKYHFYECGRCGSPYFGGERACGAPQEQQGQQGRAGAAARRFDRQELLCGGCSATLAGADCSVHGRRYIEWKCRYCCSLAMWFCFGTTHMCDRCHANPARRVEMRSRPCNPATCSLRVRHPQPGEEFCLGCGMCRRS